MNSARVSVSFLLNFVKQVSHFLPLQPTASQNDVSSQSVYLNPEEVLSPQQKNQSTSPNLPLNETIINEEEVRRAFVNRRSEFKPKLSFRNL